jgi:pseudo-rSAM protein
MKAEKWLVLDPYVYVACSSSDTLFYNTVNGTSLYCPGQPAVRRMAKKLASIANLYSIPISFGEEETREMNTFIRRLQAKYMADIYPAAWSSAKPFQVQPLISVYRDRLDANATPSHAPGQNCLSFLHEITFHINHLDESWPGACTEGHRQFIYPRFQSDYAELDFLLVKEVLDRARAGRLARINLVGDFSRYEVISQLIEQLGTFKGWLQFYVPASVLHKPSAWQNAIQTCKEITDKWSLIVLLDRYSDNEFMAKSVKCALALTGISASFCFIVQNEKQLLAAGQLIEEHGLGHYTIKPYYNEKNAGFFNKYVFLSLKKVLHQRPDYHQIMINQVLNRNHFGKITVLADGRVYANVCKNALGRLGRQSLHEIVYRESAADAVWRRTRDRVKPCRGCVFRFLCPPISNYEYALGRYDLCRLNGH